MLVHEAKRRASPSIYLIRARRKLCAEKCLIWLQTKHFLLIIYLAKWCTHRTQHPHNKAQTQTNYNKMTNQLKQQQQQIVTNLFILIPYPALKFSPFSPRLDRHSLLPTRGIHSMLARISVRNARKNEKNREKNSHISVNLPLASFSSRPTLNEKYSLPAANERCLLRTWRPCCNGNKLMADFNDVMTPNCE